VKTRRPYCIDVVGDFKGPALVVVPAGRFTMGGSAATESPRRDVTLPRAFALGMFEVSAAEFAAFCTATRRDCVAQPWDDPQLPAVNLNWQDARDYAAWLSARTGQRYRLPSEAEWEYAARGGTTTTYPAGDELLPTHARFSFKQALSRPLAANDRSLNRNGFRLYHMLGNVREWVTDAWQADYRSAPTDGSAVTAGDARVVRGGAYADDADALRSAARLALPAATRDALTGFRVLRELD